MCSHDICVIVYITCFFKACHTYVFMQHFKFSYMYTMFIMSYMWIYFFYYDAPWLLFTYIHAPHTSQKMLYTLFLAKNFAMRYFLYVDIPSYLYFAYLAFNVHASTFSYNNTFITFEVPINVENFPFAWPGV